MTANAEAAGEGGEAASVSAVSELGFPVSAEWDAGTRGIPVEATHEATHAEDTRMTMEERNL
jgi:hypothetical protein